MGEFSIGDRVSIGGSKLGVIAFIGETKFKSGEWYGIVLDQSEGRNDGSVEGTRYFQCKPKHGLFVRKSNISKLVDRYPDSSETDTLKQTKKKTTRTRQVPSGSSTQNTSLTVTCKPDKSTFDVGCRITLTDGRTGTLLYIGTTYFKQGTWAGIELDDRCGRHDGIVNGKRYFQCKKMHGVLVPIDKVLPVTMNKNPTFSDNVSVTVSPESSRRNFKHPTRTLQSTDTSLIVSSKSTTSDVIDPPPTLTSIKTTIAKPDSASIPVIFQTPTTPFKDITRPPLIEQTAPPRQSADATSLTVSSNSTRATVIDQDSTKTSTNTTSLTVSPESGRPYVVDQTANTTSLAASSKNTGLAVIDQISTITSTNITSLTLSLESTRPSLIEQTSKLQSTDITSLTVSAESTRPPLIDQASTMQSTAVTSRTVSTESTRPPLIDKASTIQSTDITSLTVPHDRTRSTVADQTSTLQSKDTTSMTGSPENTRPHVIFETTVLQSIDSISLTGSPERIGPPDTGNSQHGLHKYYERIVWNLELDMGVLDYLISLCVMMTEDKEEINKEITNSGRNRIILDILIARPYQTCYLFKEALQNGDPNSRELVAEMDFNTECTDEQNETLPRILADEQPIAEHKIRLQKNYKKIVEEIVASGHICDLLVSESVLSLDDQQEINAGINTSECNRRLLSKLIRGSSSSYTSFIKILRDDNIHKDLASDIEQTPISGNDIQRLEIGMRQLEERQNNRILVMRNEELVKRLRKMELLMAETIPENRRELISTILEEWRKDNKIFVTTNAAERVYKLIRENNCVNSYR